MLRAVLWLGARVRPKIYGSSSTRSIIFGAALLSALFAQALVGLGPLGAQEAESYIFGYGDARAEQLQQRSMHHAAPHIHATFSDANSWRRRAHAKDGPISISDKNGKRELK